MSMRARVDLNRSTYAHRWDNLGEDEANEPDYGHHHDPNTPAKDGIAMRMATLAHNATIDEFRADVSVDDSDD